jgi:hypothetical protein
VMFWVEALFLVAFVLLLGPYFLMALGWVVGFWRWAWREAVRFAKEE